MPLKLRVGDFLISFLRKVNASNQISNEARRLAVALSIATLLFGAHFRALLDPKVRFLKHWESADAWSLLASVLALAVLLWLVGRVALRCGAVGMVLLRAGVVLLVVQGLLVSIRLPAWGVMGGVVSGIVWMIVGSLFLAWWRTQNPRWVSWAPAVAIILTPLLPVLAYQVFPGNSGHVSTSSTASLTLSARTNAFPIILVVFDEWSYTRTFEGREPIRALTALRELAIQSAVFHQARSGGNETFAAVPALLFPDGEFAVGRTGPLLRSKKETKSTRDSTSLLGRSRARELHVTGFYLPYDRMLGESMATCVSRPVSPRGDSFSGRIGYHFLDILVYWQDPWVETLRNRWYLPDSDKPACILGPWWWQLTRTMTDDAVALVRKISIDSMTLLHLPLPHPPLVFQEDGGYQVPTTSSADSPEGYRSNLLQLDHSLGKILSALRERKIFDQSLVIVTSDHSWRADLIRNGKPRDYEEKVRHVPLLVKWPGSSSHMDLDQRFHLSSIVDLIEAANAGVSLPVVLRRLDRESNTVSAR